MEKIYAFGLIDAQRGFMPADEGERLGEEGFGELPIPQGERIVYNANRLLGAFAFRFTTQDWHPQDTNHFSDNPDFNTTWPVHCVAGTPGALLHPKINAGDGTYRFIKGTEALKEGHEDTSYTGYNGFHEDLGLHVPEFLKNRKVTTLVLGGLALDYCVKATALDFKQKMGLDVVVITDATEAVNQETGLKAVDGMEAVGIRFATTDEILREVA